ncbi:MAG: delta-60 repeat domain-containing protein, partial [Acidimicrobiales bacterium]|nr:delta-60 repeat domain-containing protein [Acidimicrobiales bacterium]
MQRTSVIWRAGKGAVALMLALATLVAFAGPAWADTHMDESFSDDGARIFNRTSKNDEARSLAFRSDGSVVVGGWDDNNHSSWKALRMVTIAIAADGTGSGPFSSSHPGVATPWTQTADGANPQTDRHFWSPLTDSAEEVLLLSDGRYAFVGHAGDSINKYDCVVMVRKADAFLDNNFSGNGKKSVRFSTSNNDQCYAGALQSDDKILVGGWVYTSSSTGRNLALARINPSDGSFDTSFGSGGKVTYNAGGNGEHIKAIDVQPDGKILVAGTTNASGTNDFFVARYTSAGVLDTSFSGDGIHVFSMGGVDYLEGMDLQSDGKIVVGGYSGNDWAVARLTTSGAMDTSFGGGDGITVTNFGGTEEATEVIVASDGKILLGGYTNAAGNHDFALVRYTSTGVLDTTFNSDGVATHDFGSNRIDKARAMGIAANGNVLLVGSTKSGGDTDWGMAQFISSTQVGTPGFTVSETSRTVSETGSTQTFTVVLTGQPSSNVVIDVASNDTGEATVSASSLTFANSNWDTPQTITVTGIPDFLDDGDQTSTVTLSVNDGSSDDDYDSLANKTVSVTTTDIDLAPAFTTAITAGNTCSTGCATIGLAEGGNTGTISVVLGTAPAGNVVFDVTASDTTEATVSTATLTFTNSNWDTPQVITVSSVDDDLDDARQNWTVTVAVNDAASHDAWDSLGDQVTNGKTTDDDTAGFTLSGTTASVSETGTTDTFTVVLDSEPTGNVVFGISSADTGETTVSAAALTFTTSNWDTPQTITVTGIDDTATDGNQTTTVTVTVNDSST